MDNASSSPVSTEHAQAAAPAAAGTSTAPASAPAASFNASTAISSMGDLEKKAPTVYKAMLEGIATNIINEMKAHEDRMKEINRKNRDHAEGKD